MPTSERERRVEAVKRDALRGGDVVWDEGWSTVERVEWVRPGIAAPWLLVMLSSGVPLTGRSVLRCVRGSEGP